MKALTINCTLKASPEKSNTEALADVVAEAITRSRPAPSGCWSEWTR
jgi:hypothetical protein